MLVITHLSSLRWGINPDLLSPVQFLSRSKEVKGVRACHLQLSRAVFESIRCYGSANHHKKGETEGKRDATSDGVSGLVNDGKVDSHLLIAMHIDCKQ